MPEDGTGRFGYTNASPYAFYFMDLAWLPWLEVNARFTTFDSIYINENNEHLNSRRYMDKAIDLKFMLWHNKDPQNWIVPSIAFGIVDMMGTELMQAKYAAATWRFGKVAATLGYGDDRLNGFYGGLEWDIADWLTVKAEYSPLDYAQDRVGGRTILDEIPDNKINAGIVLKAPWGMQASASYQRDDDFVFSISQRINLKGPSFLGIFRKRYEAPGENRFPDWDSTNKDELLSRIKSGLEKYVRVRDVDVKLEDTEDGHKLTLSYENYGYSSHAEAMTRVLVILAHVLPETSELALIHKNAGVPIVRAEFPGSLLFDIRTRTLREEEDPVHAAVFTWASADIADPDAEYLDSKARHDLRTMFVYQPRIDQTLGETYMDRLNIDLIYTGRYDYGLGSVADVRFPIYNNVDTTDIYGLWWEKDLNDEIRIQKAGMTYAHSVGSSGRAWLFGEGGWLNEEFFGANIWARYYAHDGRWWLGGRLSEQHDRDPYSFGGLTEGRNRYYYGGVYDFEDEDEWRFVAFAQVGYNLSGLDLDIMYDYGRFADEDKGHKVSLVRHWDDTALGFWYINTDVKAPDKDFTNAGVHMEMPAEKWFGTWFGNSSSHIWEQNTHFLSTWDMESGREGGIIRTPERMMSQLRPVSMKKNVERLLRDYCSYDDNAEQETPQEVTSLLEYLKF